MKRAPGSINRETEFSSGKRQHSDLYAFEHSKYCPLCPVPRNSFSCHKLWYSRDKLIHFRATSCYIRATSYELFSLFLQWIKNRYIGQCVKNKIPEYLYNCAIHLFLCLLFLYCTCIYLYISCCMCMSIYVVCEFASCVQGAVTKNWFSHAFVCRVCFPWQRFCRRGGGGSNG